MSRLYRIASLVTLFHFFHASIAYPDNVPSSRCAGSMQPSVNKHLVGPQDSSPPYTLVARTQKEGRSGTSVTVRVNGAEGLLFRGIILQARTAEDMTAQGHFTDINETIFQAKACFDRNGSAVIHNSRDDKSVGQSFTWNAPDGFDGDIYFIATIVQELEIYWLNITSPPLTIRSWKIYKAPTSAASPLLPVSLWITAVLAALISVIY